MNALVNGDGTVTIKESDWEELIRDQRLLDSLRAHGVDSWDGWDDACDDMARDAEDE
jgi:hypothetical protein